VGDLDLPAPSAHLRRLFFACGRTGTHIIQSTACPPRRPRNCKVRTQGACCAVVFTFLSSLILRPLLGVKLVRVCIVEQEDRGERQRGLPNCSMMCHVPMPPTAAWEQGSTPDKQRRRLLGKGTRLNKTAASGLGQFYEGVKGMDGWMDGGRRREAVSAISTTATATSASGASERAPSVFWQKPERPARPARQPRVFFRRFPFPVSWRWEGK
jgi:hypothetical protein